MIKRIRRSVSVVLMVTLLACIPQVAMAQKILPITLGERMEIVSVLADVEQSKQSWGLANADFTSFEIGNPIKTYNYADNALEESMILYPIMSNGELVLWAVPIEGKFQITNGLVKEIRMLVRRNQPFALVYDADSVYAYLNDNLALLRQSNQSVLSRDKINSVEDVSPYRIETARLDANIPLEYGTYMMNAEQTRATNVSCNVSYVTQNPYNKICWAAAIACIANYKNNTNYTAVNVAQNRYGSNNFNQAINVEAFTVNIRRYGLPYYVDAYYENFDNKIYNSLLADNPVGGAFDVVESSFHATTIFGINILAGRIQVMDPEFGSTTATLSGSRYTYTSVVHGTTLVLHGISYDEG